MYVCVYLCLDTYICAFIQTYIHTYISDKHVMAAGQGEGAAAPAEPEQERPNPQKGRQGIREVLEQEKQQSLRWEIVIMNVCTCTYVCMYVHVCMYGLDFLESSGTVRNSDMYNSYYSLRRNERYFLHTYSAYIHTYIITWDGDCVEGSSE